MSIDGKVAVVTGGGRGSGRSVCERLAREGARLAIFDLEAALDTVSVVTGGGGTAIALDMDVGDECSVADAFAQVDEVLGPVAVLANVAGVFADVPFLETSPPESAYCASKGVPPCCSPA